MGTRAGQGRPPLVAGLGPGRAGGGLKIRFAVFCLQQAYLQAVNLHRPRVVPSLSEMWPGGQPPESLWRLQNACPRCGLVHSVAALVEKSGPSHRDFECPHISKRPLISIFWNGAGWTWRMDPVWALGLQPPSPSPSATCGVT